MKKGGDGMTNVELLKEKVRKSGMTHTFIADRLGISRGSWYRKLNGSSQFTAVQIQILCGLLHITSLREKEDIFFVPM